MAHPGIAVSMQERWEVDMHVVMLSLTIAFAVCVLLFGAFWLFTISRFGRRLDRLDEPRRRSAPHTP
jgi:hypothetical protein